MTMLLTELEVQIRKDMGLLNDLRATIVPHFHWKFGKHRFGPYYEVSWESDE